MQRTIQVLCRRQKNNPLLVGDPGVGKTAIAEGLARKIVNGEVPEVLADATVFSLDMGTLLAGTRYRGDFEERLKQVMKEIENHPKAIMFIDEIHTVIGAGRDLRRRDGCLEPAEAGAGPGHAALHRLDDLQGIPPVLREGPRAGAPLPEDRRQRAVDPGRDRDPEGPEALFRGVPPAPLHQRRHQGGGGALGALHPRPQAAGQGDRRDRRDRRVADAAARRTRRKKTIGVKEIEATIATMARIPPKTVSKDDAEVLRNLDDDPEARRLRPGRRRSTALSSAIKLARAGLRDRGEADRLLPVRRPHRRRQDRGRAPARRRRSASS